MHINILMIVWMIFSLGSLIVISLIAIKWVSMSLEWYTWFVARVPRIQLWFIVLGESNILMLSDGEAYEVLRWYTMDEWGWCIRASRACCLSRVKPMEVPSGGISPEIAP